MKIIKRVPWAHTFTCSGCKSELEAERDDVEFASYGSYGETDGTEFYVKCPVCGTHKVLEGTGDSKIKNPVFLPEDIRNEARHRYNKRCGR